MAAAAAGLLMLLDECLLMLGSKPNWNLGTFPLPAASPCCGWKPVGEGLAPTPDWTAAIDDLMTLLTLEARAVGSANVTGVWQWRWLRLRRGWADSGELDELERLSGGFWAYLVRGCLSWFVQCWWRWERWRAGRSRFLGNWLRRWIEERRWAGWWSAACSAPWSGTGV